MLSNADKEALAAHVARVEARTGVQVVTAVVDKADHYPEIVWTAFALAASLAAFAVVVVDALRPAWIGRYVALTYVLPVLAAGGASALAAAFVPAYARLFLRPDRRERMTRQFAHALFLDHDLCATQARRAVLLLVARFERKVELVADRGFGEAFTAADWRTVVEATTARLAQGDCVGALNAGLDRLERLCTGRGLRGAPSQVDELPDAPLEASVR